MERKPLLTMEELMEYVYAYTSDTDSIHQHYTSGTIDVLYTTTVNDIVTALMMIPINRLTKGLTPTEENDIVADAVNRIAGIISIMCSKPRDAVQAAILQAVENFPASDVRESTILRQENRLN